MFHHVAHMPSRFCQIPICPQRIGQMVEHSKFKPTQPSPRANGIPCTQVELLGNQIYHITLVPRVHSDCTETGLDAIERLRFLASFPLQVGGREGGKRVHVGGKRREARIRNATFQSLPIPSCYVPFESFKKNPHIRGHNVRQEL